MSTLPPTVKVTLTITSLAKHWFTGKYYNIQTTEVEDSSGKPLPLEPVTMFENAGRSGGYAHGETNSQGLFVYKDTYPRAGQYTEWSVVRVNGVDYSSEKITVIVP